MTSLKEHQKSIEELINDINEKIRSNLLVERQKLIGFSASEVACDLFATLLHKKNLIFPGFNINHRFFVSEKSAKERFNFDFPEKNKLISLLVKQEKFRTLLCYGKSKEKKAVEGAIKNIFTLKEIIERLLGEEL